MPVNVNMTKAREIHLAEIRRVRNEELVKEDVTFMRAVEAEDTDAQNTIKTKKQTLRDLPATFDITTDVDTPEQLKAKWPSELPDREQEERDMADLTQYLTAKYNKMIGEISADLGKTADDLANVQNIIKALKNPDMLINGVSLTLDMVQIMENGDIRILPPPPAPAITEVCVKEPEKNGKKDSKELANVS